MGEDERKTWWENPENGFFRVHVYVLNFEQWCFCYFFLGGGWGLGMRGPLTHRYHGWRLALRVATVFGDVDCETASYNLIDNSNDLFTNWLQIRYSCSESNDARYVQIWQILRCALFSHGSTNIGKFHVDVHGLIRDERGCSNYLVIGRRTNWF